MPMIDVYAAPGTFADKRGLAQRLAATLMEVEQVPDIPMFRSNTAAFVHELPAGAIANVDGAGDYVRVQVLTNAGALDRGKQLAVVERFTAIVAEAPHFADHHELVPHGGAGATDWTAVGADLPLDTSKPLGSAMADYYLTNPIARASATMAECSREFVTGISKMAAE